MSGSPARRAATIAIEYATTPPAATAALACAGPERKTALQFIVADSTNIEQKVRNAGSASAPPGQAKCAVSTAASSALGSSLGVRRRAATTTPSATAGNCARTPMPAAAAPAAMPEPTSRPRLQAPCSADSTGRPRRCSTATPCAFAATSTMLTPAPSRQAAGRSDGEGRRERRRGERRRNDEQPEHDRAAAAAMGREPARARQQERRDERDREDDEAELAAVEPEALLDRRQPRDPGAVDGAEGDEGDRDRDVGVPKLSRRRRTPRRGV